MQEDLKMSCYKRLSPKDSKKENFYKNSKKVVSATLKWGLISTGILAVLGVGVFSFYSFIDKQFYKDETEGLTSAASHREDLSDTQELNELGKSEIERESKKAEKLNENGTDFSGEDVEKSYDFSDWNKSCAYEMMVINKDNFISDDINIKIKNCRGKEISAVAYDDLESMISDAKKDGIILWISSGYRDINYQKKLFNRQIEREKSKAVITQEEAEKRAGRVVARPKTSEHNTGLAVDFNGVSNDFYKTKEYKWLMDNAHKYGFIERYQKKWKEYTGVIYEPWHFRYVGKENAPKIKDSGLCLEEYVETFLK